MADVTSTFAAKDVGFTSTVNRMQRSLAGFQSGIGAFAVKAAGLVTAFVGVQQSLAAFRNALNMGGRLDDLSKTTGEAAGNLAALERAFQNNGLAAEQVGVSLAKMSEFVVGLQQGIPGAQKAADAMGISMADLADKTPTERMKVLLDAIAAIRDPALRTATAVDVFGRSGRAIIPLATDFSGALGEARAELGSLVPILNENAASLDELGDKLENSVGNKLNELAVGFAAGITGANDFVTALSRIDAAGFGKQLGDSLRVAFDAPHETAKAIGYTLLTGVKQAGNNLMNAFSAAIEFFQKVYGDPEYWSGVGQRIKSVFMEAVNAFNKLLLTGIEQGLLKPLSNLPGIIGDPFREALKSVESIRTGLEATSQKNYDDWTKGGEKIQSAIERAASTTEVIEKDWLGVEQSADDAARHFLDAQEASAAIRDNSAETAKNFGEGSAAIRSAMQDIRGFDLKEEMGPDARPDWTKSNKPPPNTSQRLANDFANESAMRAPRGGGSSRPTPTRDQTVAQMRADAARERATRRVGEFMDRGAFGSAAAAMERGDRRANRILQDQRGRDVMGDLFGAKNIGDSLRNFERDARKAGMTPDEALKRMGIDREVGEDRADALKRFVEDQAKTPEERKAEEEAMRDKHAPKGGAAEKDLLSKIHGILETHMKSIDDKLPQHALAA
jgi:hypothetical protein